jgi:hypothetical protein
LSEALSPQQVGKLLSLSALRGNNNNKNNNNGGGSGDDVFNCGGGDGDGGPVKLIGASALSGRGVRSGLDWLCAVIPEQQRSDRINSRIAQR